MNMKNNNIKPRPGGVVYYVLENGVGTWYYTEIQKWIMTDWGQFGIAMDKDSRAVFADFLHNVLAKDQVEGHQIRKTMEGLLADKQDSQADFESMINAVAKFW